MKVKNHQYHVRLDALGLKFIKADNVNDASNKVDLTEYRLGTLNNLGLRFVMAFSLRHQETDIPVTIAIFEEIDK